ncbi:MAG: hypothetical protein AAB969_01075 [Patescibacteria group bacterium]
MGKIKIALNSLKVVFTNTFYLILVASLFIIITLVNFLINSLILSYDLLVLALTSGYFNLEYKTKIFFNSLTSVAALPLSSIIVIIVLSALLAIEISAFIFYFKKRVVVKKEAGLGLFSLPLAFLGVGCSACGSLILSSLIGFATATALIGFMPLKGLEFGLLGIFILLLSIYLIASKISSLNNCKI